MMAIDGIESLANSIPKGATGSKAGPVQHAFIRSLILGTSPEGYISLCSVIATAQPPDYGKARVPLLILVGAEDKTAPLAMSETILKSYGTGEEEKHIEILEGVGHWHCVEAVEAVRNLILPFLEWNVSRDLRSKEPSCFGISPASPLEPKAFSYCTRRKGA